MLPVQAIETFSTANIAKENFASNIFGDFLWE